MEDPQLTDSQEIPEQLEVDPTEDVPAEPAEPPKFTEEEINTLIDTFKLFIKKKQPNSVCLFPCPFTLPDIPSDYYRRCNHSIKVFRIYFFG